MCGIVGILNQSGEPVSTLLLKKMAAVISHRGPDGDGTFNDGALGLGHIRLAIIDLSLAGHQPMMTPDRRFVISYNGELYNYLELRTELESIGVSFHSKTDTEVVLQAFAAWGTAAFSKFNGMLAAAIWDRHEKKLYLVRDRYGVKPLYWYFKNGQLIFGSEIKAILQHPSVKRDVSYPALNEYFTFQNIFSDLTLFKDIRLLPAGAYLCVSYTEEPTLHYYWDYQFKPDASLNEEECSQRLYHLFLQAVNRQLVADVPVGAYLSGGMDSGSITAIATRSIQRLSTFTCGFDLSSASGMELGFDERAMSEVMANAFKTEHYEVVLHAGDMEYILPRLIWHLEDLRVGQCYPNYYVARLASKFVKVSLSGAGGDELFAGYPWRYFRGKPLQQKSDYFHDYYAFWQRLIADKDKEQFFNTASLSKMDPSETFNTFTRVFDKWSGSLDTSFDHINAALYFELKTFLHGLLIVEDKLSMAHSLETRVPFLDNDLVDFALQIPTSLKLHYDIKKGINHTNGKVILRKAMSQLLPKEIVSRKKQGFSAPDASWFRGESIDYINRLLRDPKALIYEFISPAYVRTILDEHCKGQVNHRLLIWSLLSFEWWCRLFLDQQCYTTSWPTGGLISAS